MPADLAALLPWQELVGEWVTQDEASGMCGFAGLLGINYQTVTSAFNTMLTRKWGLPPVKEVGHE